EEKLYQRRWHGENTSHVNEHHQTANTHRVQREALARQGLSRFWDVHVPDSEKPRNVTYQLRPDTKMVVFWPDYSRSNPYQKLLYGKLRQTAEVVAGDIDAALRVIDTQAAPAANVTFHVHWLNALFKPDAEEATARAAVDGFLTKLEKFVWKGGRLIWTIHNTISHDTAFPELERELSARLAALAHHLHFHSRESVAEVATVFDLPSEKLRISRHGHYIGAYADYVSKDEARHVLGIGMDEDVILFSGQIRRYKGVDDLVTSFRRILAERPKTRLLLAGRPDFDPLEGLDPALTEAERARILSTGRFVEEGELQLFFRAADIAAYPYQKILTSGSLLLALSFGVPTVIPRVGMTADVLEGRDAGRLYEGSDALEAALRDMLRAKDEGRLAQMSTNARTIAEEMDWPDFGAVVVD
ncbi:MAG: glycosyltransferase family 4 protein, partial [Rhodobacteraceae bacterium]|nr:glycosyltransferase family 4 protein [Paracoccaceae bacterium]